MKKVISIALIIGLFSPMIVCAAEESPAFAIHIRALAASCAACHGTQGNAVPSLSKDTPTLSLAGVASSKIATALLAFKSGERPATVMQRHAKGLTDAEIHALAAYFSRQQVQAAPLLPSQTLRSDHAH